MRTATTLSYTMLRPSRKLPTMSGLSSLAGWLSIFDSYNNVCLKRSGEKKKGGGKAV
jgi:hypothetical protein